MRNRRPINKGMRCQKWQRVSGPGGRRVLRCKAFKYPTRLFGMGYRRGHRPDNLGATCLRRKQVWSPGYNKKVWRCAKYGPGSGRRVGLFQRGLILPPAPARARAVRIPRDRAPVIEGRIPLSLPSMERMVAGRTPG